MSQLSGILKQRVNEEMGFIPMKSNSNDAVHKKPQGIGIGLALGVAMGAAFESVGIGLALGLCFGVVYDAAMSSKPRRMDKKDE